MAYGPAEDMSKTKRATSSCTGTTSAIDWAASLLMQRSCPKPTSRREGGIPEIPWEGELPPPINVLSEVEKPVAGTQYPPELEAALDAPERGVADNACRYHQAS